MPALKNARHERYAQERAKGKSATEAMSLAGLRDPRNSTRLTKNDEISARIAELQERGAIRTETTVASITERLKAIADKAEQIGDASGLSVARAAMVDVAKINGLVIERTENVNINHDVSDEPMSEDEWAEQHSTSH